MLDGAWYNDVGKISIQPTFLDQRGILRGRWSDLFEKALVNRGRNKNRFSLVLIPLFAAHKRDLFFALAFLEMDKPRLLEPGNQLLKKGRPARICETVVGVAVDFLRASQPPGLETEGVGRINLADLQVQDGIDAIILLKPSDSSGIVKTALPFLLRESRQSEIKLENAADLAPAPGTFIAGRRRGGRNFLDGAINGLFKGSAEQFSPAGLFQSAGGINRSDPLLKVRIHNTPLSREQDHAAFSRLSHE